MLIRPSSCESGCPKQNKDVEVPGQYFEDKEPADHIGLERFHSEVCMAVWAVGGC